MVVLFHQNQDHIKKVKAFILPQLHRLNSYSPDDRAMLVASQIQLQFQRRRIKYYSQLWKKVNLLHLSIQKSMFISLLKSAWFEWCTPKTSAAERVACCWGVGFRFLETFVCFYVCKLLANVVSQQIPCRTAKTSPPDYPPTCQRSLKTLSANTFPVAVSFNLNMDVSKWKDLSKPKIERSMNWFAFVTFRSKSTMTQKWMFSPVSKTLIIVLENRAYVF